MKTSQRTANPSKSKRPSRHNTHVLAIAAIVLALFSTGLTLALARLLAEDRKEFREELARLRQTIRENELPSTPQLPAFNPLEGLRIGIAIKQDHEKPTFAELLKDRLNREDADAVILSSGQPRDGLDALISGTIQCNGYADVYYSADLICTAVGEAVVKIGEKPAEGGRQSNLAAGLVGKLKREIEQSILRAERRRALREMRE